MYFPFPCYIALRGYVRTLGHPNREQGTVKNVLTCQGSCYTFASKDRELCQQNINQPEGLC
ncbi:MAG: hypothetical protein RID53_08520 [Coleofasciculus sp. B1-GNL1-01]|uniref:hypothetical protein n=1 Tax=Coleofasciculus sp. B1-GNL1-01 TaxID=3068484 RepID=UPI0032F42813